jgi:hypothetical protein
MPKTSDDLVREALSIIGAAPAGQPVAAEDAALVRGKIGPKLAELASRRILYVADHDAIDDAAYLILADLLAAEIAPDFGLPRDLERIVANERRLRSLHCQDPVEARANPDYF